MNRLKLSLLTTFLYLSGSVSAFSTPSPKLNTDSRRNFIQKIGTTTAATIGILSSTTPFLLSPANAGPEILKTPSGVKYAITQPVTKGSVPQQGDFVVIEYTGYLSNGQVRNKEKRNKPSTRWDLNLWALDNNVFGLPLFYNHCPVIP